MGSWQSSPWNWWQLTRPLDQGEFGTFGPVYACWAIIAQEVSRVPLFHQRYDADGTASRVYTQAPARVLRNPNGYQTRSDFLLYLTRSLLADGNAYALAVRNNRFEVSALYPVNPRRCWPYIDYETGGIFYRVSDAEISALSQIDPNDTWVPARDMLHIRLFTPGHPLVGETPLVAAATSVQAGAAINQQMAAFFTNMSRPSGVIRHPGKLEPAAVQRIKERFKDATTGPNVGDPVVFTEGMEWTQLTMSAVDAELIASAKLTQLQVAQIYRVPPFFLGDLSEAKFATVESLTRWFINSGLGFYLDHISDSLTKFFELPAGEEILFDYEKALLHADFKTFMEALEVGTRSGVLSPNEARRFRNLAPVENGDEPRVQQQLVPLSYGMALQPAAPSTPAAPAADPVEPDADDEDPVEARSIRVELLRRRLAAQVAL
jgi:HK97 family phage portal protein